MLVIVSDLHLTDETTSRSLAAGAMGIFVERLRELAWRASWRADGKYRPLERFDIVLLGDIIDMMHSRRWHESETRPWHDLATPRVVETVAGIVDDVLRFNAETVQTLRAIAVDGAVAIPPASQSGDAISAGELRPVSARIFYMVGNQDWPLHVHGGSYDMIRQKVAHHLGLANPHNAPFPHDPSDLDELLNTLRRHRVLARHGDIFDPLSFSEDRGVSSLGDAINIELLGTFMLELERTFQDDLPGPWMEILREADQIRPLPLVPVWIEGVLERLAVKMTVRKEIKRLWDSLADRLLSLDVVRDRDSWSPFQLADGLERSLKFSKRVAIGWARNTMEWLASLRGAEQESYYQHALSEPDYRNRRARHIVYGHTHQADSVPLDASSADGYVLNQMYFNAGTWRRVYRATRGAPSEREFVPFESMSYLAFFHADERSGRPYEHWSGGLGVSAGDNPVHRIDGARTAQASEPTAPTRTAPIRAPHYHQPQLTPVYVPTPRRS